MNHLPYLKSRKLFGGKIKMLPERKGNRMTADVLSDKTKALGWAAKRSLTDYIDVLKKSDWEK